MERGREESRKFNIKSNAHFSSIFTPYRFFCLCLTPSSLILSKGKSQIRKTSDFSLGHSSCVFDREKEREEEREETFEFIRTHHACLCLQGSPRERHGGFV